MYDSIQSYIFCRVSPDICLFGCQRSSNFFGAPQPARLMVFEVWSFPNKTETGPAHVVFGDTRQVEPVVCHKKACFARQPTQLGRARKMFHNRKQHPKIGHKKQASHPCGDWWNLGNKSKRACRGLGSIRNPRNPWQFLACRWASIGHVAFRLCALRVFAQSTQLKRKTHKRNCAIKAQPHAKNRQGLCGLQI